MADRILKIPFSAIDTEYTQKPLSVKIRLKFGLLGHVMLTEVINWINGTKGCYAEYTEDTAPTIAMTRLGSLDYTEEVEKILRYMLEIGFFDAAAFAGYKILTSKGIVRRWKKAIRRIYPESLPEPVQNYLTEIEEEEKKEKEEAERRKGTGNKNAPNVPQNAPNVPQNAPNVPQNAPNAPKGNGREGNGINLITNKQTNKEAAEKILPQEPPPADDAALVIAEAKNSERWSEIRGRIAALIYEPGLSADLTDAIAAAAVRKWITVPQLHAWLREARNEKEVNRRTDQRFGKKERWKTLRPWIEQVYLAHEITLPKCDPRRKEPPPPPEDAPADTEQAKTAAGRALVPK